jgi:hypothetical protein
MLKLGLSGGRVRAQNIKDIQNRMGYMQAQFQPDM